MNLSYNSLEREYYQALRSLAFLKLKNYNIIPTTKLPYLLENSTLKKARSSNCFIISSISGAGKTTISKYLLAKGFGKIPNVTTRPRRPKEKKGEYVFIDNLQFKLWKKRKMLFNPHRRNGVWHAMLWTNIKKLEEKKLLMYMDKSVASSIFLKKNLSKNIKFTFIYILAPTFKELYRRVRDRETSSKDKGMKQIEILNRFREEISDMKKSSKLPYVYIVNDSQNRVRRVLEKIISGSK